MNRALLLLILLTSLAFSESRFDHLIGTWKVDTNEVKAHIRGIDQEGVYVIPDNLIPAYYVVEQQEGGNIAVTMKTESGGTWKMKVLLASPNELIFTYSFVGTENKPKTKSEEPYSFPELFRCAFRTRALECIIFTDNIRYRCLAYKERLIGC